MKAYKRKGYVLMRAYVPGEDLTGISVNEQDNPEMTGGMIAQNPKNPEDQWFVAQAFFEDNYEPLPEKGPGESSIFEVSSDD